MAQATGNGGRSLRRSQKTTGGNEMAAEREGRAAIFRERSESIGRGVRPGRVPLAPTRQQKSLPGPARRVNPLPEGEGQSEGSEAFSARLKAVPFRKPGTPLLCFHLCYHFGSHKVSHEPGNRTQSAGD